MVIAKRVVTVDAVIFSGRGDLLLIERGSEPYGLALPGGVVEENETTEEAVVRELQEETNGIWPADFTLALLGVFSAPGRDPRGPTISIAYSGVVADRVHIRAGDDARGVEWVHDWEKRTLAFDHMRIARAGWAVTGLQKGPLPSIGDYTEAAALVTLTYKQRAQLKDLYTGIGAHRPENNPTLRVLREKGCVELQYLNEVGAPDNKKIPHWTITELGRAVIST